jgi:hypothetical protein
VFFAVRLQRGGPWDWARDLRGQDGWEEHATFMDSLVDEGFVVLGGPLEGDREILHVIDARLRKQSAGGWPRTTGRGTACLP